MASYRTLHGFDHMRAERQLREDSDILTQLCVIKVLRKTAPSDPTDRYFREENRTECPH